MKRGRDESEDCGSWNRLPFTPEHLCLDLKSESFRGSPLYVHQIFPGCKVLLPAKTCWASLRATAELESWGRTISLRVVGRDGDGAIRDECEVTWSEGGGRSCRSTRHPRGDDDDDDDDDDDAAAAAGDCRRGAGGKSKRRAISIVPGGEIDCSLDKDDSNDDNDKENDDIDDDDDVEILKFESLEAVALHILKFLPPFTPYSSPRVSSVISGNLALLDGAKIMERWGWLAFMYIENGSEVSYEESNWMCLAMTDDHNKDERGDNDDHVGKYKGFVLVYCFDTLDNKIYRICQMVVFPSSLRRGLGGACLAAFMSWANVSPPPLKNPKPSRFSPLAHFLSALAVSVQSCYCLANSAFSFRLLRSPTGFFARAAFGRVQDRQL